MLPSTASRQPFPLLAGVPALFSLAGGLFAAPATGDRGLHVFETSVRPLLARKCLSCHSKAAGKPQGGLLLDSRAGWQRGGVSGPAVVPGDPDRSPLILAVRFRGPGAMMPPAGKLSEREIAALEEWVRLGAPDPRVDGAAKPAARSVTPEEGRRRWAFSPLKTPVVPRLAGDTWSRTEIDRFILQSMRRNGVSPSPTADRRTLIRRASLDLLGLPPTPEEVDEFLRDQRPDAWARVIDRLLASPHYGERWGRHWLDLARFAESHGYEQDYDRPNAYHYRDFVIRALNEDLPYDRFVQWQIAGDELAPENPLAWMATGFLAAGTHATQITKNQVEKERYDELDDIAATIGTSILGLTIGCARCHDHKFDPIPMRDYYSLVATFTRTVRSDYDVDFDREGYEKEKSAFDAAHAPLLAARERYEREQLPGKLAAWLANEPTGGLPGWRVLPLDGLRSTGGAKFRDLGDGSVLAEGTNAASDAYELTVETGLPRLTALRVEALAHPSLTRGGPGRAGNGNFALTDLQVTVRPAEGGDAAPALLERPIATFEQKGLPVAAVIDGDRRSGWAVDPKFGQDHAAVFHFASPPVLPRGARIHLRLVFDGNTGHNIGRLRLSLSADPAPAALGGPSLPERVDTTLRRAGGSLAGLAPSERELLLAWFRDRDPGWSRLDAEVQRHAAQTPQRRLKKVLISSEGVPAVRTHTQGGDFLEQTHLLRRGDPNQKQEAASPGVLRVLARSEPGPPSWKPFPPAGSRTPHQRAALARWLTDVESGAGNLLARVIVNRLWQRHLGRGIVATPSDFGAQGEPPTHPELLDHLAGELVRSGWSLKKMHRRIMLSAVYTQSAQANPATVARDPGNRWFGRFSRRRLEAEAIRDSILAVSGRLDRTQFGPGSLDETMRRRSIYFTIKRSRLIPSMLVFDAPDSLQGIGQRPSTTVAPQALWLINSATVVECARAFAEQVAAAAPDAGPQALVEAAYRQALGRAPAPAELQAGREFLARTPGDRGALADFCQVLFGLNEFLYLE